MGNNSIYNSICMCLAHLNSFQKQGEQQLSFLSDLHYFILYYTALLYLYVR